MKRIISIVLMVMFLVAIFGCASPKTIEGIKYDTYGLINKDIKYNPEIEYRVVVGNVIWSGILMPTIIAPIYFIGFSICEPVGKMPPDAVKGQISY